MTNKDRQTFESEILFRYPQENLDFSVNEAGQYCCEEMASAWEGWCAARDHYAPKLTEGDAVEAVAKAIHHTPYTVPWEYSNVQARENARDKAKAALRAAGVRWKEEA